MKITVTKYDMEYGKPGSPLSCPVAMAVHRDAGASVVEVHWPAGKDGLCIEWINPQGEHSVVVPPEVATFISKYDRNPMTTALDTPEFSFELPE